MRDDPPRWPPLILPSRAPWPLRVRDAVATVAAWFVLAWVLRDALLTLVAGASPIAAERVAAWVEARLSPLLGPIDPLAPKAFWQDFQPYLITAAVFVAWLVAWGWLNREELQRQPPKTGGSATPDGARELPEQGAAAAALWQQSRQLHVTFDAAGRIVDAADGTARR